MRAIILWAIVLCVALRALANPRFGLLGYIWFALMRPDLLAYTHGAFSTVLAIGVLLGSVRRLPRWSVAWIRNPLSLLLIAQTGVMFFSACYATYPDYSQILYWRFFNLSLMALLVPLVIRDAEDMRYLVLVTAVSLGYWGLRQGMTGLLHGGLRIDAGIGGGFMDEANTFAAGMAMLVPFCWYGRELVESKWARAFFLLMTGSCISAVVLTRSRGGALALLAVLLVLVWELRHRLVPIVMMFLLLGCTVYLIRDTYIPRMASIGKYEEDGSAMSRVFHDKLALQIWRRHPWLGVGYGHENYYAASEPYIEDASLRRLVVHNSFLEILVECGILAALFYTVDVFAAFFWAWHSARSLKSRDPAMALYSRILMVSLLASMVASLTQPRAYFDFHYCVVMYVAAWYAISRDVQSEDGGEQVETESTELLPAS